MKKAIKILSNLKRTEPLYALKVKILAKIIDEPDNGHLIDDRLVEWARKAGINVDLHCEDRIAWFTCNMRNKK